MNICIRDLLAPYIVLDKSDITMFEYYPFVLIVMVLLGYQEFKFSLFI